jgi:hypothetical protein
MRVAGRAAVMLGIMGLVCVVIGACIQYTP